VWEGFFKAEKRRWGYYVLPILFGDRLVGRIEPRIDREASRVEVLGPLVGGGLRAAPSRRVRRGDAGRTQRYLRFAAADRLAWAPHLAAERRLFAE
jgi:uncharacterized protein YcaQ